MNNLSNKITSSYLSRFNELPKDKQAHFATRLYLWSQDPSIKPLLSEVRPWFTAKEQPHIALEQLKEKSMYSQSEGTENALNLRLPYFERYPKLRGYVLVLFRIHFLRAIYDIDCRDAFYKLFPRNEVEDLRTKLINDPDALSVLSTRAINFLYMLERILHQDDASLPLEQLLNVGRIAYDRQNKTHLMLLVYFYTHCIIGESQFYYRNIPSQHQSIYDAMLEDLEQVIRDHYDDINLDNKFEFLVCCQIVGKKSNLQNRIFAEAERSLSDEGDFIIDRHNNNPQTHKTSLDQSEHRNALFIMANLPYQPINQDYAKRRDI